MERLLLLLLHLNLVLVPLLELEFYFESLSQVNVPLLVLELNAHVRPNLTYPTLRSQVKLLVLLETVASLIDTH